MKRRLRDLILEIAIALALVFLVLYFVAHRPHGGAVVFRWLGLPSFTAIAFGYPLKIFRAYWRRLSFWLVFGILLGIHLTAYVIVFRHVLHVGTLLLGCITILELQIIISALQRAVRPCRDSQGSNS